MNLFIYSFIAKLHSSDNKIEKFLQNDEQKWWIDSEISFSDMKY